MRGHKKKGYRRKIDITQAKALYAAGYGFESIGQHFGASRQAAYAILVKVGVHTPGIRHIVTQPSAMTDEEFAEMLHRIDERLAAASTAKQRENAVKDDARNQVTKAVAKGVLKPTPCEVCGMSPRTADGRRGVHAHHDDYTRPLAVRWLCEKHHKEWHRHNTAKY